MSSPNELRARRLAKVMARVAAAQSPEAQAALRAQELAEAQQKEQRRLAREALRLKAEAKLRPVAPAPEPHRKPTLTRRQEAQQYGLYTLGRATLLYVLEALEKGGAIERKKAIELIRWEVTGV